MCGMCPHFGILLKADSEGRELVLAHRWIPASLESAGLSLREQDIVGDRVDDVIAALNILLPTRDPV
jgi:molybdopterin-biosynthesis enzyme MoeA-like protein